MVVRIVALIACFSCLAEVGDSKCVLPNINMTINYNMLPGTWYYMQGTWGHFQSVIPCFAVTNIRQIPGDGVYVEARDIRAASDTGDPIYDIIPMHLIPNESIANTYRLDDKYESFWYEEVVKHSYTARAKAELTYLSDDFHAPFTILTDYKHYILVFQCYGANEHQVWSHTRHPHSSDEAIRHMEEALAKIGGGWDVTLYPSGCDQFNIRDPIINS